jgi:hypothetical protein
VTHCQCERFHLLSPAEEDDDNAEPGDDVEGEGVVDLNEELKELEDALSKPKPGKKSKAKAKGKK